MKELSEIQKRLIVQKNQMNKFGGYKYRSCEDILEAVKPLLGDCTLTLSDEIMMIGDRYYVNTRVTFTNSKQESVQVMAFAREAATKKGMDEAQITGAASSYARKYALNGLFCIDDVKDPDHADNTNNGGNQNQTKTTKPATKPATKHKPNNPPGTEPSKQKLEKAQLYAAMLKELKDSKLAPPKNDDDWITLAAITTESFSYDNSSYEGDYAQAANQLTAANFALIYKQYTLRKAIQKELKTNKLPPPENENGWGTLIKVIMRILSCDGDYGHAAKDLSTVSFTSLYEAYLLEEANRQLEEAGLGNVNEGEQEVQDDL